VSAACLATSTRAPGEGRDPPIDEALPFAYGKPANSGRIKTSPDDFRVDERLAFTPSQDGEHVYLQIEKLGENTEYVARQLARFADVPPLDIGYAGLKDRQGRTRQWFSIRFPRNAEPDWSLFATPTVCIVQTVRHRSKLKRGDLAGNRFDLTIRDLTGPLAEIDRRISLIAEGGVPNYFGPQRFGKGGGNLESARDLLLGTLKVRDRHLRGLYLSAARSELFNRILGLRVERGLWNRPAEGDWLMTGSDDRPTRRWPAPDELDQLLTAQAVHPAGTLWGRGGSRLTGPALALEHEALRDVADWCEALERAGLNSGMRPLRMPVTEMEWHDSGDTFSLCFTLPPGSYATSVLRELVANPDATEPDQVSA
jgi:tRNA pseudouridine13 synthase